MNIRTHKKDGVMKCSSVIEIDGILYAAITKCSGKTPIQQLVDESGTVVHEQHWIAGTGKYSQRDAASMHKGFLKALEARHV